MSLACFWLVLETIYTHMWSRSMIPPDKSSDEPKQSTRICGAEATYPSAEQGELRNNLHAYVEQKEDEWNEARRRMGNNLHAYVEQKLSPGIVVSGGLRNNLHAYVEQKLLIAL